MDHYTRIRRKPSTFRQFTGLSVVEFGNLLAQLEPSPGRPPGEGPTRPVAEAESGSRAQAEVGRGQGNTVVDLGHAAVRSHVIRETW
ncbi:hypothetical protein R5W23_002038 [Gemmata sp. JC673]|uniref:Uncharacterized protein n=1 Tax=Gemmata algarum TaxID=2975278 RepID=A0ABU5F219_9BACT|nr:hypothetical protein [Gemmata algarum]MDY3560792.1 hypothetical protein [Gemmata algarum]